MKDKIDDAIIEKIAPLYDIWAVEANLTEDERLFLYDKLFNPDKPTETDMAEKLYCDVRTIRRMWKKIRDKINKILP